jgi:hypothetical protein
VLEEIGPEDLERASVLVEKSSRLALH